MNVRFSNAYDPRRFVVGQPVIMSGVAPWWRRLWRWVTRYRPALFVVSAVDYERGVITYEHTDDLERAR